MTDIPQSPTTRWFYNPLIVIAALLLMGPFAFPLLWKSPSFSRFWKILLTVAVIVMTVYMLWGTWKIVDYVMAEFKQLSA